MFLIYMSHIINKIKCCYAVQLTFPTQTSTINNLHPIGLFRYNARTNSSSLLNPLFLLKKSSLHLNQSSITSIQSSPQNLPSLTSLHQPHSPFHPQKFPLQHQSPAQHCTSHLSPRYHILSTTLVYIYRPHLQFASHSPYIQPA